MTARSKSFNKAIFVTNAEPTQANFGDLIDSYADAGAVVSSLNTLVGDVVLVAGTNITLTPSGNNITITAAGSSGIAGSIAATQIAVGIGTNTVGGTSHFTFDGHTLSLNLVGASFDAGLLLNGDSGHNALITMKVNNTSLYTMIASSTNFVFNDVAHSIAAFTYTPGAAGTNNLTFGTPLITLTSATTDAGLNVPHGTAPTSPVNGDVWTTTAGIFAQINGATVGPLGSGGGGGGVSSLNSLTGGLTIVAGSGVTVTPSGSNITIAATGGGGGSGGIIGSAAFNPSAGSIVSPYIDGIISSVTYISTGRYQVTFVSAEADTNYTVSLTGSDDNANPNLAYIGGISSDYTVNGFIIQDVNSAAGTPRNPQVVRVAIMRTGGGGGAVDSVNTRTGDITLIGTDIPVFVGDGETTLFSDCAIFIPGNDSTTNPADYGTGGTFTGTSLSSTPGPFNNGLQFPGSGSQLLSTGNAIPALGTGTSWTMAFWMKTTSSSIQCMIATGQNFGTTTPSQFYVFMSATTAGHIGFNAYIGGWATGSGVGSFESTITVNDGLWHFILCEKTPTNLTIEIDGSVNNTVSVSDFSISNYELVFGNDFSAQYFIGSMAEMQFYGRALTSGEKTQLFTEGFNSFGGLTPGAVPAPSLGDATLGKVLGAGGIWVLPGVIGTACFNPSSGTISGLVIAGAISGVTRLGTGQYQVNFAVPQPDINYAVSMQASDDNVFTTVATITGDASVYTVNSFNCAAVNVSLNTTRDPQVYRVTVFRMS